MAKKDMNKIASLALVLSVIALLLSGYSLTNGGGIEVDDEAFNTKVEKGIEAYIEKQQQAQAGQVAANTGEPVDVSIDDDAIKGDKNAPVTIVEFSDYECPFCVRFYQNTLPQIVTDYIDTGKVRMVFRDFPLGFHRMARSSSIAAECARDQKGDEMYYEYHDKMYDNQSALSVESLKKWAGELGLNQSEFDDCLDSEKFGDEIDKDFADGQSYGVTGTPAFFINGRKISGAQPFSVFKTIIDEELAK